MMKPVLKEVMDVVREEGVKEIKKKINPNQMKIYRMKK